MADTTSKRLVWDADGSRTYETGVDHGVLYVYDTSAKAYKTGVAWNGLTGVTESPSGAEETALWADNMKYLSIRSAEEFGGTIEAYTYPDEFAVCDGSINVDNLGLMIGQQTRAKFAFAYRTIVGNDTSGNEYGEKIHVVYNASVSPSERAYATVNDSPEANTFSWEFTTTTASFKISKSTDPTKEYKTSLLTIDLTGVVKAKKEAIYNKLWGAENGDNDATLPEIGELADFVVETLKGE